MVQADAVLLLWFQKWDGNPLYLAAEISTGGSMLPRSLLLHSCLFFARSASSIIRKTSSITTLLVVWCDGRRRVSFAPKSPHPTFARATLHPCASLSHSFAQS